MKIALIGPTDRPEMVRLSIRIEERGSTPVVIDPRGDPPIRLEAGSEHVGDVSFEAVRAVYVADLGLGGVEARRPEGAIDAEASLARIEASRRRLAAWNALLERLGRRMPVVNPPATHDLHGLKPWETAGLEALGIPTPGGVATSDPEALFDPPESASGGWIRKGLVGGRGYTETFEKPASPEAAAAVIEEAGAVLVQERVLGPDLRVFVFDGEVLGGAEIVSRAGNATDNRRGEKRFRRLTIPDDVAEASIAAARRWGLIFTAIDWMRDEVTGGHRLLEANSAPFFATFERLTGVDVSTRLAEGLKRLATDRGQGQ